jgi:hypothetical protein
MKLPKKFKPNFNSDLIRIGKSNDGGYVVSKKSLHITKSLISFGLNDDWSFEKNFKKINKNITMFVYDGQVTLLFWIKRFFKEIIYFLKNESNIAQYFKNLFTYFEYKYFFLNNNTHHVKKNVCSSKLNLNEKKKKKLTNILEIIKKENLDENIFLKIDIEGSEYEILEDILSVQKQLTGVVIEFHNCFFMKEHIEKFIDKCELDLIHIHVNNYGETTSSGFPLVIEMTFSKNIFNFARKDNEFIFPNLLIDQPNNPEYKDEKIIFES